MNVSAVALAAVCALAAPSSAQAAPANTLREMFGALKGCMASVRVPQGSDITIQFALNRSGALLGKPRVTHAVWPKGVDPRAGVASLADAFDRCVPVSITDGLGGAVAGRQIFYRFRGAPEGGGA